MASNKKSGGVVRFLQRFAAAPRRVASPTEFDADFAAAGGDESALSLGFLLRQSANAIGRGRRLLSERGRAMAAAIDAQGRENAVLLAQAARLAIALFWLFIAVMLAREMAAAGGAPVRGLASGDAQMAARVFFALAALGVVAAFVGGFLARGLSGGAVREAADALGGATGRAARDYGETLDALRAQLERQARRPGDALDDLARMHLVALEASAFFSEIQFLSDTDGDDALAKFRGFLRERAPAPPASGAGRFLLFALGAAFGVGLAAALRPGAAAGFSSGLPLWVLAASLGFALLYFAVGPLFRAAGGAADELALRARAAALDRVRAAFAAESAPRLDDLVRRTEDAAAILKARLGDDARREAAEQAGPEPAWRRPPEPPQFVAARFDLAPPAFRVGQSSARNNAEPKQPPAGLGAPPWKNR